MKKILAILTIVAMLSGMVVIGASADEVAPATTYAFEEDFESYELWGEGSKIKVLDSLTYKENVFFNPNTTNANDRVKKGNDVASDAAKDSQYDNKGEYAYGRYFALTVPGFFKDKKAGNYTVSFRMKTYGTSSIWNGTTSEPSDKVDTIFMRRVDVGTSVNNNTVTYFKNDEGFNNNGNLSSFDTSDDKAANWTEFSFTLPYKGSVVKIEDEAKRTTYDETALCLYFQANNSQYHLIDDVKITQLPFDGEFALESIKTPLSGPGIAYPNNFDTYEKVGASTELAHKNANDAVGTDAITHIDKGEGVYSYGYGTPAETQYLNQVAGKSGADGDYAVSANRIWIKIPEFFKDKSAGTYSVSFDYKKDANTDGLYAVRIDVGATINGGNTGFHVVSSAEGFNTGYNTNDYKTSNYPDKYNCARQLVAATNTNTNWQSLSFDFAWDGNITEFTNSAKESTYDKYGFCFMLAANGAFQIDNLVVTGVDSRTGTIVDYANKDMTVTNRLYNLDKKAAASGVVINAAYDQNGNLRVVNTADISVAADADYAEAVVTLPIPAGVTKNWQFKGFIWSDLDNEIEPLTESSDILEGRIFNGSFEIMPKTGTITSGVEHNAARNWNATTSDGTSPVIESEGGAVDGNYLVGLVSGYGVKANISDLLAKYGAGTYKFKVYAKIPGSHTLVNGMYIEEDARKSPKSGFAYPGISYQDNNDVITTDLGTFYAYNFEYTVTEDDMAGWSENSNISMGHYYNATNTTESPIYFDALTFTGFTPAQ